MKTIIRLIFLLFFYPFLSFAQVDDIYYSKEKAKEESVKVEERRKAREERRKTRQELREAREELRLIEKSRSSGLSIRFYREKRSDSNSSLRSDYYSRSSSYDDDDCYKRRELCGGYGYGYGGSSNGGGSNGGGGGGNGGGGNSGGNGGGGSHGGGGHGGGR